MPTTLCQPTIRRMVGTEAIELHCTAIGESSQSGTALGAMLYRELAEQLRQAGAHILHERLFASPLVLEDLLTARQRWLGELDDGVPPVCLSLPTSEHSTRAPGAAVQLHAVVAADAPRPLVGVLHHTPVQARQLVMGEVNWLYAHAPGYGADTSRPQQAERALHAAAALLQRVGGSPRSIARTWYWLDHILEWYAPFNQTRNQCFRAFGLIEPDGRPNHLPASTGIGIGNAGGGALTLEWIALPGREEMIQPLEAGGQQNSAFRYGSAFSRACTAPSPAGQTLYISGTAAIDPAGRTEHVGEIEAQIAATFAHVRALLAQFGCGDQQVLSGMAYGASAQVLEALDELYPVKPWPLVSVVADVCRPDLLFEIELTAQQR